MSVLGMKVLTAVLLAMTSLYKLDVPSHWGPKAGHPELCNGNRHALIEAFGGLREHFHDRCTHVSDDDGKLENFDLVAFVQDGKLHRRRADIDAGWPDNNLMDSIPDALAATDFVCSSVNVGSTRAGINMDAAFKMAGIVKKTAEATADRQCIGAGKLVVFPRAREAACVPEDVVTRGSAHRWRENLSSSAFQRKASRSEADADRSERSFAEHVISSTHSTIRPGDCSVGNGARPV